MIKLNKYCLILQEKTIITWNGYTKKYYMDKGYNFTKIGDKFEIKTLDLMETSTNLIKMKCPICGKEYFSQYRKIFKKNKSNINIHTICSPYCFTKIKMKNIKCDICNEKAKKSYRFINNKRCCEKCQRPISRKGYIYKKINEPNDIILYKDFAEIIIRNKDGEIINKAKIDLEDIDKVKNIKWRGKDYIYGSTNYHPSLKLHRLIMDVVDDLSVDVDHIYHDKSDNRKKYLKLVTHKQNCNNRQTSKSIKMAGIKNYAIEDGEGIRTSLYCVYCTHACPGCHNQETWNGENGYYMDIFELFNIIQKNDKTNVTFSGGDPFFQWYEFYKLAQLIKKNTNKTIWIYSGFTYEQIINDDKKRLLLENCDVLVDGRFEKDLKDLNLKFRGSSNQRIIDIKESLKQGIVVERTEFY